MPHHHLGCTLKILLIEAFVCAFHALISCILGGFRWFSKFSVRAPRYKGMGGVRGGGGGMELLSMIHAHSRGVPGSLIHGG